MRNLKIHPKFKEKFKIKKGLRKIHPKFKEKFKIKKGLRKMAKLNRMNTRFQRGAVGGNCIRPV